VIVATCFPRGFHVEHGTTTIRGKGDDPGSACRPE
jgi:hypothetical protein